MAQHCYLFVDQRLKDAYLVHLCNEAQRTSQTTAIFTRSVSETRWVSRLLDSLKIGAISLRCDLSPSARATALDKLRRKECHVIVTTDVAAGIDRIPNVDRIINFSLTWKMDPQTYAQRISNATHAGNSGHAITFVTQYDLGVFIRLEKVLGEPFAKYAVDMDMILFCRNQVDDVTREDPSLIREAD